MSKYNFNDYDYSYKGSMEAKGQVKENIETKKIKYRMDLLQNDGVQQRNNSLILQCIDEPRKFVMIKDVGGLMDRVIDDGEAYTFARGGIVNSIEEVNELDRELVVFNVTKGYIMDLARELNIKEEFGVNNFIYYTGGHFELIKGNRPILRIPKEGNGVEQLKEILKEYYNKISINDGEHLIFQERKKLNAMQYMGLRPFWFECIDETV